MLIPPSLLLILYGIVAEQSIGDLFIAGILPGLLLAGLVLGGIYGGLFTPTEAGAVGALGAFVIAALRGGLNRGGLWRVLQETGAITVSISIVILAASLYATMLALSGLPSAAAGWLAGADVSLLVIIALYCLVVIALGCLLDSSSILLVVVPLMLPILQPLGVDLIWFGIVTIVAVEIGLITPPFGISIFVIRGALPDGTISLGDIFVGALPFVGAMLVALALLVLFPSISTVLIR